MTNLSDVCGFEGFCNTEIKILEFFFKLLLSILGFVSQNVNIFNQSIQIKYLFDLQSSFIQWDQETQKPKFLWKVKDIF